MINPVAAATPAFVVLIAMEMVDAHRRAPRRYEPRDTMTSLLLGLGSAVIGVPFAAFTLLIANYASAHAVFVIGASWTCLIAALVLDDLTFYFIHRSSHRVRWFWASHVVHHSSQHFNLSTALRQPWTGILTPIYLLRLPLFIIGIPPTIVFFVTGLSLVYQFWIHTGALDKMPRWFEAVMNTPSHHRVHHAVNPRYLDTNYGGIFIVWDRMFGTFAPENPADRPRFGIVTNIGSFNVVWAAIHEWSTMITDIIRAGSWRARVGFFLGNPGWSPDDSRETSETIRQRWRERHETL